ncbi:hypothetical protein CPB84DRAFT_215847 [Gymnopilus junonius]|uniref:Uncharacterized protein n=1 Tax=Gymnopilus junonius TaxID=109634 RepID=A0A9P5NFB1_GYMJU|nr:hypothetical protein CPB84DRAFT_215847 [Gymnopilus junonius]
MDCCFTIALREHGLITTLTTTPIGQEDDGRLIYSMKLHFLEFSTGKVHPKARDNHIFFMNTHNEEPMAFMQVVGEYLTLICSLDNGTDDCILVLNWQTNEVKMRWLAPHGNYLGHRFLTTNLLLFANKHDLTLDIFRIPSKPGFTTPTPILVLHLPQLSEGFPVESFHLCIKPNPGSSPPQQLCDENEPNTSTRSYLAKADNAIFIFRLQIYTTCFTFIVHRNALVDLVDRYGSEQDEANNNRESESKNNAMETSLTTDEEEKGSNTSSSLTQHAPPSLPYASWGPDITRWFSSGRYVMVLSTWGQKHVQISHNFDDQGASIRVLDFNPASVQRFKAKENRKEKTIDAELPKQDGRITPDADNGKATLIDDKFASSSLQGLSPEMEDKDITLVEEEIEADSEEVQELNWEREDEHVLEELGNPGKSRIWCVSSVDRVEPTAIFAEPVWCKLPYVASSSENLYAFNDVIIDEERILGLQKDFWGFLESIEIVHIG